MKKVKTSENKPRRKILVPKCKLMSRCCGNCDCYANGYCFFHKRAVNSSDSCSYWVAR